MKTLRLFLIAATMLAVAACNSTSTPPPELPDFPVSGQFLNAGETPMPSTVTLVAIHPDTYETTPVPVSAQSVVYGDLLAIDTSIVGDDGSFEWDLGDGSDIPAGYMAPASQAFVTPAITDDVTCTSTASAAVSVLRSLVFPGAFVSPIGIVGPLSDDANFALGVAVYTDAASLDPAPTEPFHFRTWVFSKGDVSITGSCVFDNGTDPVEQVVTIDVDLVEGWNEVTALADNVNGTSEVTNDPFEGAWLFFAGGF